jgi:hypothetical protein
LLQVELVELLLPFLHLRFKVLFKFLNLVNF